MGPEIGAVWVSMLCSEGARLPLGPGQYCAWPKLGLSIVVVLVIIIFDM